MADRILLIDDDDALRESLELVLAAEGYEVVGAEDAGAALTQVEACSYDVILCDLRMPGVDGMDLLPRLRQHLPQAPVIMMSAYGTEELALEAMNRGAADYLPKPFQPSEAIFALRKAQERERLHRANQLLQRDVRRAVGERPIVATSEAMIELLEMTERAAAFKSTVLVTGESGTGKEVLARSIHAQSPRRNDAFVAVNCGAIPETLLESELFGHAKGAFTGADRARRGLFREAHGGTLFLDEIGELPTSLQVKLLRVLQEEEVRPIGETKTRAVDVRLIAATARDLALEVREGRFREDLFYRLDVVRLELPPLRERPKDVPLLLDHFLARCRVSLGKAVQSVTDEALEHMLAYPWPGNVRELENVVERAVILADGDTIGLADLPENLASPAELNGAGKLELNLKRARRMAEIEVIRRALRKTDGNRTHAARLLEISHRALLYKLKEYGIRD
ncbi:MAG: sigma-54 dependent transcriptional regulator [Myxococcota bacterium]|jgi:two-component system response regulator AtoC|nr:sigma-54-dependent Fis family transcriptional regulator [bacterium]MDP6074734.1 sigma-54 dependent transcriptional regulator [Myxococcota bacterium]MDP7073164.1 sigma-54 dependent transcriptional regulator [Myxococcota bacterium]MDP7298460.1 sigma-54 dependent transcriptional regulator [Myxococcota bacterium]MDP7432226.1 sigma-54 dependent transcriptional regulator [Myxococcota bacterium]